MAGASARRRASNGWRLVMPRLALVGISLAAVASSSACGGDSSYGGGGVGNPPPSCTAENAPATTSVSMETGMVYSPSCVKISPGATITFHNADSIAHTVTTTDTGLTD